MKIEIKGFVGENTIDSHDKFYEMFEFACKSEDGEKIEHFQYKRYGKNGTNGKITMIPITQFTNEPIRLKKSKQRKGYEMTSYTNSVYAHSSSELEREKYISGALGILFQNLIKPESYRNTLRNIVAPNIAQVIHKKLSETNFYLRDSLDEIVIPEVEEEKPVYKNWGAWA